MEFGTWYALNCGPQTEWRDDFALARDSGFDFIVLWHLLPDLPGRRGDVRQVVLQSDKTLRALDEVERAGIRAYLGVWHPYYMGPIPVGRRLRWADGRTVRGPDLFNPEWVRRAWLPYVRRLARTFGGHRAYRGAYFDDTFPVLPTATRSYLSYSSAAMHRFREWLKRRYLTVGNLNARLRLPKGYRSFGNVRPPREPAEGLALWTDWTAARADWCEEFARQTVSVYRSADRRRGHELVLSDQDYHMQCNRLQYGVDYPRLMRHFDRFEIYMSAEHTRIGRRELLANVEADVARGRAIAGDKPFQFHTWFADRRTLEPMSPATLRAVVERAAETGADAVEIYTFKVYDWRRRYTRAQVRGGLPPFREMSLRYNPAILRAVARTVAGVRS